MRRIGNLTEIAEDNPANKEVIDEIVSLSKRYGIISPYTSFLAVADSEKRRLGMVTGTVTNSGLTGASGITMQLTGNAQGSSANTHSFTGGSITVNGDISVSGGAGVSVSITAPSSISVTGPVLAVGGGTAVRAVISS